MITRLNHVAIVVPDLEAARALYAGPLGMTVSAARDLPEHGIRMAFVDGGNAKVELMEVLGDASPIAAFLARSPGGGIHHMAYEVEDILAARDRLVAAGLRIIGDGTPRAGAHGNPVLFLHPKDFLGTLIELEEVKPA